MHRIIGLLIALTVAGLSEGSVDRYETLEPVTHFSADEGELHDYSIELNNILICGADAKAPAMMVTRPSFSGESMVQVISKNDKMVMLSATASKSIWYSRVQLEAGQKKQRVRVKYAERELGGISHYGSSKSSRLRPHKLIGLARRISATMELPMFLVRWISEGETWSPEEGTICGKLVALGYHLDDYVHGKKSAEMLAAESRELLDVLQKKTH
jgi:hypothetical protein